MARPWLTWGMALSIAIAILAHGSPMGIPGHGQENIAIAILTHGSHMSIPGHGHGNIAIAIPAHGSPMGDLARMNMPRPWVFRGMGRRI